MPDFSISDMPWLTQPADPVRSFSTGAAVGSQIAQNRAQRQSLAQRRYEFEQARQLQQRDQSLQERLAPLQEQALRMQNDLGTYKLDELKRQLTMREANAKIVNEVGSVVLESVLTKTTVQPEVAAKIKDLVSRLPMKNDPELLKWLEIYNDSAKIQAQVDPESFSNLLKLGNLEARQRGLAIGEGNLGERKAGTELRRTALEQSAVGREAQLKESGLEPTISLMPDTIPGAAPSPQGAAVGQPLVKETSRPLTTANATTAQAQLSNSLSVLKQIETVLPMINSETVGLIASGKGIVMDRFLSNFFPELANKERIKVDELFAQISSNVTKALKSDYSIAEPERRALVSQIPTPGEFKTSPVRAFEQLQVLSDQIMQRAIRSAAQLKQTLPDETLPYMDSATLQELYQSGVVSRNQAQKWYQIKHRP